MQFYGSSTSHIADRSDGEEEENFLTDHSKSSRQNSTL